MNFLNAYMCETGMAARELADLVGVSPESVRLWRSEKRRIAPHRVARLCAVTGLSPEKLRPDIFEAGKLAASPAGKASTGRQVT